MSVSACITLISINFQAKFDYANHPMPSSCIYSLMHKLLECLRMFHFDIPLVSNISGGGSGCFSDVEVYFLMMVPASLFKRMRLSSTQLESTTLVQHRVLLCIISSLKSTLECIGIPHAYQYRQPPFPLWLWAYFMLYFNVQPYSQLNQQIITLFCSLTWTSKMKLSCVGTKVWRLDDPS